MTGRSRPRVARRRPCSFPRSEIFPPSGPLYVALGEQELDSRHAVVAVELDADGVVVPTVAVRAAFGQRRCGRPVASRPSGRRRSSSSSPPRSLPCTRPAVPPVSFEIVVGPQVWLQETVTALSVPVEAVCSGPASSSAIGAGGGADDAEPGSASTNSAAGTSRSASLPLTRFLPAARTDRRRPARPRSRGRARGVPARRGSANPSESRIPLRPLRSRSLPRESPASPFARSTRTPWCPRPWASASARLEVSASASASAPASRHVLTESRRPATTRSAVARSSEACSSARSTSACSARVSRSQGSFSLREADRGSAPSSSAPSQSAPSRSASPRALDLALDPALARPCRWATGRRREQRRRRKSLRRGWVCGTREAARARAGPDDRPQHCRSPCPISLITSSPDVLLRPWTLLPVVRLVKPFPIKW